MSGSICSSENNAHLNPPQSETDLFIKFLDIEFYHCSHPITKGLLPLVRISVRAIILAKVK